MVCRLLDVKVGADLNKDRLLENEARNEEVKEGKQRAARGGPIEAAVAAVEG